MNLLVLPRITVHNANAFSSPYTIGFPAMTAWLGFTHALERQLQRRGYSDLIFRSTAVISHKFDLQAYKGRGDFVHSIIGTANPLDSDGTRSSFIEEPRCHLQASIVIEYETDDHSLDTNDFRQTLCDALSIMKLAGGDILSFEKPYATNVDDGITQERSKFLRRLMPGYVLVERRELMETAMSNGHDAMEALLDHLVVHHGSSQDEHGEVAWHSQRREPGWIVPIATGFQGISPVGLAKNQRDPDTPHRFAEAVVTLGEFIMVNNIKKIPSLDHILWSYATDLKLDLYLCQQNSRLTEKAGD